jgi:hypothetical protein
MATGLSSFSPTACAEGLEPAVSAPAPNGHSRPLAVNALLSHSSLPTHQPHTLQHQQQQWEWYNTQTPSLFLRFVSFFMDDANMPLL